MIGHLEIQQREIFNRPLWWYDGNNTDEKDSYRQIRIAMKELTGYQFDNHHLKWSNIYGELFAVSVYFDKKFAWSISVWDQTGMTSIVSLNQSVIEKEKDILSLENYHILCDKTEQYTKGMKDCSGCGNSINMHTEIAGRYFAGTYCKNCWESKYKAIEAKETYE